MEEKQIEQIEIAEVPTMKVSEISEDGACEVRRPENPGTLSNLKVIGKIDLDALNQRTRPVKKSRKQLKRERMEQMEKNKVAIVAVGKNHPEQQSETDDEVERFDSE